MTISNALLADAIAIIATVPGVEMDPEALADDVILLAYVWPDETEFKSAVVSVHDALSKLVDGKVDGAALKYGFAQWRSYHFQHHRFQGARADMRIVYQRTDRGVRVRGFGHRHLPADIYRRLAETTRG